MSPNPGRGLQNFQPVQGSAASSSVSLNTLIYGVFALFPHPRKVRRLSPGRRGRWSGTTASRTTPVLQTVEQLPNVVQFFATYLPVVAEPVITVPKIVPHDAPARRLCRDTQLAEQLVEVPTTISVASLFLQRLVELSTPVPGGGGRNAGLHGLLHGQGSTATHSSKERISERIVEHFSSRSSEESISERIVEQIADIPVPCGDPQGFRPGQSSVARLSWSRGFFALFHR